MILRQDKHSSFPSSSLFRLFGIWLEWPESGRISIMRRCAFKERGNLQAKKKWSPAWAPVTIASISLSFKRSIVSISRLKIKELYKPYCPVSATNGLGHLGDLA